MRWSLLPLLLLLGFSQRVPSQDIGGVVASPQAITSGQNLFERTCGACHGVDARGGRNGAPDLLDSNIALGATGPFAAFVRTGVPNAGMPGFALDDPSLGAIHDYLRILRSREPPRGRKTFELVGNAARGRQFFEQQCARCHSIQGDLQHIGTRYAPRVLQGRIVMPRGSGVNPGLLALGVHIPGVTDQVPVNDEPRRVEVRTADGRLFEGNLLRISDFDVALRDQQGQYHSFARHGARPAVTLIDPAQPHIDLLGKVPDEELHDLTAYLAAQK
jgi:cytochrome c oxidase cbb3-type subunit 3